MNGSGFSSWPTATAASGAQTTDNPTPGQTGGTTLAGAAEMMWPTPMAGTPAQNGNSAAGNSDFSRRAEELARLWTTPQAQDVTPRGSGQVPTAKAGNACLATDAAQWPTPAAQNVKGSSEGSITRADGKSRMDILHYRAEQGFSRPAPETLRHGPTLSQLRPIWRPLRASVIALHGRATWRRLWKGRAKRRLNPLFVEWLMGWPPGHALCDCSATEFALWSQRMRGALSAMPMAYGPWIWTPGNDDAAPEQMTMQWDE
jgi:hypothetical protein